MCRVYITVLSVVDERFKGITKADPVIFECFDQNSKH